MLGGVDAELDWLSNWWAYVLERAPLSLIESLPSGWIHGDFHGRNLVFSEERVVAVFDFDDIDTGPYVCDIAFGVFKFGRESRPSFVIRPEYARSFLEGYEAVRTLTVDERAVLPLLVVLGHPPHPQNYRYWRDVAGQDISHRFRANVAAMQALRAEVDRVGPVLGWPSDVGTSGAV